VVSGKVLATTENPCRNTQCGGEWAGPGVCVENACGGTAGGITLDCNNDGVTNDCGGMCEDYNMPISCAGGNCKCCPIGSSLQQTDIFYNNAIGLGNAVACGPGNIRLGSEYLYFVEPDQYDEGGGTKNLLDLNLPVIL